MRKRCRFLGILAFCEWVLGIEFERLLENVSVNVKLSCELLFADVDR